ncbi:MAG: Nramp family divalent metal transporter [Patescibacteria group bacterium]|nr:Nramp family divalent metal transporter [Patescibacteria group bacterium]
MAKKQSKLPIKKLPKAPPLKSLIGPSFIILGLGLGSGEVIMWPYLASTYGMGLIWGALLGLTFQFFMNMEIERYALARGESVFVGYKRLFKHSPLWYIFSTFVPWMWPGIAASSAVLLGYVFGMKENTQYLAIGLLIAMGLILSLGPVLYKTVERLQKTLIMVGVPTIFVISILLASPADWGAVADGIIGKGEGFWFLPAGISIASFLAALAYAGAGGNLNLAQSFYVKEKGFGMGKYAGRITSLFNGKKENISLEGAQFAITKESKKEFNKWWKRVNIEHFLVFWLTGSITIILLSLLAYTTVYLTGGSTASINFVINESIAIGEQLVPAVGTFFLIVTGMTLFGTQLTVFDATSRIISENIALQAPKTVPSRKIPKVYYTVLWLQIIAGIIILSLGFKQPLQLLTIAAVLNAFAMFVHTGMTLYLNKKELPKAIGPSPFRTGAMITAFLFYGGFSIYVIITELQKLI